MQHLYISYPEGDYAFAHRLVEYLQAAGYPVFVDAVSSVGTMAWAAETRHAIRTCGVVLMVLSPAEGRRTGMRHEGILAKRRHKPVVVLRRTPGDLPRYLEHAAIIDCVDDQIEAALPQILAALPPLAQLMQDEARTPPRRPPRHPALARRRRRLVMVVTLIATLVLCLLLGIALGVIPV